MNGPVRPWSSKPRQRDLTPMLRRPVEPAMPGLRNVHGPEALTTVDLQCSSLVSAGGSCLITMTEHERGAAGLPILSAALNVVASVFIISMLGLTGAAIATAIVLTVWKVATAFFIARHLRLRRVPSECSDRHSGDPWAVAFSWHARYFDRETRALLVHQDHRHCEDQRRPDAPSRV